MARIRTIKPEFWTDAALIECSLNARLLFIGTWNFADDCGNLDRSAKQIKARIFPADNVECEPLIAELINHGLLIEYSVNDKKYLHISGFTKHQVINRPGKPQCPPYDESQPIPTPITEPSLIVHAGREGKGREKEGNGEKRASPSGSRLSLDALPPAWYEFAIQENVNADPSLTFAKFSDYWKAQPGAKGRKADWDATWRNWVRREKEFTPKGQAAPDYSKLTAMLEARDAQQ